MAVTFVDLISLPDISSVAPGLPGAAGAPTVAPGVFDDKLQDGLALAGALAVAASPTTVPPPAAPPALDVDVSTGPITGATPPIAPPTPVVADAMPAVTEATASTITSTPAPTSAGPLGEDAMPAPSTSTTVPTTTVPTTTVPTAATATATMPTAVTTTASTVPATTGAALQGVLARNAIDDAPGSAAAAGTGPSVPIDAQATGSARVETSLARRLLGGLRRGHADQRAASGDPTVVGAASPDAASTDTALDTSTVTSTGIESTVPTDETAPTANDPSASPTNRVTGHETRSDSTTGTGATAGPEGASGTGQFHTDKVRYLRDLAPARELQRLAVDLDDARVAVRFSAGATTVDVVSDPSSRLDAGWVSSVEKTLRQLDTPATPPSGGSRDGADARNGGQDRSMHDERRRRALEDATQRRWHDATTTSRED
jgi:hypothetical protein